MYKVPPFIKMENDQAATFNGDGEFIFYVPEVFFTNKCAVYVDEFISIIGVMDYTIVDSNGKNNGIHRFNAPTVFLTKPSSVEKVKDVKLIKSSKPQDYRLFHYKKGDKIIVQVDLPNSIENVEDFFRMFIISGHMPNTIPYNELYKYPIYSMQLNRNSFGLTTQMFGIMQTELARDPSDKSRPFRLSKAKKEGRMNDYITASIKEIPNYISPYVEMTSENWDDSLIISTLMDDKNIKPTPLEKVMTS